MELLDRYLQAVKKHLPWQRQDDIIAELRANLEAQLDDKEAALDRPLTTAEAETWLKQLGSPMQVAAPYQPQQYLIGPAVFPTYLYVMRLALMWTFAIYLVVCGVQLVAEISSGTRLHAADLLRTPWILVNTALWVTAVFAALEFITMHYPSKCPPLPDFGGVGFGADWSPSKLPPLEKTESGTNKRGFAHAAAEVIFGLIGLVWLLLAPWHPLLLLGPGARYLNVSGFDFSALWPFYWWVVGLSAFQFVWKSAELWRGTWQRPNPAAQVGVKIVGLIAIGQLLSVPNHEFLKQMVQGRYAIAVGPINDAAYHGLMIVFAIAIAQAIWETIRIARTK